MSDPLYPQVELLRAVGFAAERHRYQLRKGADRTPYINHPIAVAELLAQVGGISDLATLAAALLHDTVEDTKTEPDEIEDAFGVEVCDLVVEVTDDKRLPKAERKRLQIVHGPHLSERARAIKIADKTCNVRDITHTPPSDWSMERKIEYLDWAEKVVSACRGVNQPLERYFDEVLRRGRDELEKPAAPATGVGAMVVPVSRIAGVGSYKDRPVVWGDSPDGGLAALSMRGPGGNWSNMNPALAVNSAVPMDRSEFATIFATWFKDDLETSVSATPESQPGD